VLHNTIETHATLVFLNIPLLGWFDEGSSVRPFAGWHRHFAAAGWRRWPFFSHLRMVVVDALASLYLFLARSLALAVSC
jgi:hypothetical protein